MLSKLVSFSHCIILSTLWDKVKILYFRLKPKYSKDTVLRLKVREAERDCEKFPTHNLEKSKVGAFQEICPVGNLSTQIWIPVKAKSHSDAWEFYTCIHNV